MITALAYGEILFDILDGHAELGGAPFNFCAGLSRLGACGSLYSAVGRDSFGLTARKACESFCVNSDFLYALNRPTGVCNVETDKRGEPTYELIEGVAYDIIPYFEKAVDEKYNIFYFGTLAQRSTESRQTLDLLLRNGSYDEIFFDINLRMNYYNPKLIRTGLMRATLLKINLDECSYICENGLCGTDAPERGNVHSLVHCAESLCGEYGLNCVIITMDKDGAFAYKSNGEYAISQSAAVKAVSAVGAGDAFSAAFVYNYMNDVPLSECVKRACILGAYTICFEGALPPLTEEIKSQVIGETISD